MGNGGIKQEPKCDEKRTILGRNLSPLFSSSSFSSLFSSLPSLRSSLSLIYVFSQLVSESPFFSFHFFFLFVFFHKLNSSSCSLFSFLGVFVSSYHILVIVFVRMIVVLDNSCQVFYLNFELLPLLLVFKVSGMWTVFYSFSF